MRTTLCFILISLGSVALAKKPKNITNPELTLAQTANISVFTPLPKYPYQARLRCLTGSGLYRMHVKFDTGQVKFVETEKSTGHALLDQAAKETLLRWRFNPKTLRQYVEPHDRPNEVILRQALDFKLR